jgi:hypothetical protein
MSGHNAKSKVSTYLPVPQTPLKPGALVYLDDGGIQREYWQPGDGDGVADSEFPNKPLFKERYRFFQTDIGPIERGINSPPHYVALDDKAVWDIVSIKKYTVKERAAYWPFDFMANGVLRANRRHKGRAAEFAADYEGDEPMPWITAGPKNNSIKYYLSGQPNPVPRSIRQHPREAVRPEARRRSRQQRPPPTSTTEARQSMQLSERQTSL